MPFIGGNGYNSPQLAKLAGRPPRARYRLGLVVTANAPGNQAFVKAYQDKYSIAPDQFAAQAFTGAHLMATAIKNAGAQRFPVDPRRAGQLRDVDTVLGKFSFDENRDAVDEPVVQVVKDGQFVLYK